MWSDPIDELIGMFGRMLERIKDGDDPCPLDSEVYQRTLRLAKHHRELENATGKVGFEATNG